MDADGSNLKQMTYHEGDDAGQDWSPDGKKIAFCSNRDGEYAFYVMDVDGTNVQLLFPRGGHFDW